MIRSLTRNEEWTCSWSIVENRQYLLSKTFHGQGAAEEVVLSQPELPSLAVLLTLLPVLVAFVFVVFLLYRSRREAYFREKETSARLSIAELEMKVLRSQMNPHFIFNCLNSIQHFIHRNNAPAASDYLIKFSRLIRHVLEASYERMIPLSDEITALRLYMELEQLRTKGSFVFQFDIDEGINPDELYVPPLFVQPLVENAIWHGLSGFTEGGRILLTVEKTETTVKWTIQDNGKKAEEYKEPYDLAHFVKRTSRGISLIHGRLEAINQIYSASSEFKVEAHQDDLIEGTRVTLTLPYEN